jgi:hypothetical protein
MVTRAAPPQRLAASVAARLAPHSRHARHPRLRIDRVLRVMLWSAETWPQVKAEL